MEGTYEHSIDAKGRLFVPARLKEELGVTFHLVVGSESCIWMMPEETWKEFSDKIASIPMSESGTMRVILANACKCELDSQGRIIVPNNLRAYGKLEKDVVIIGMGKRAEIWDRDSWKAQELSLLNPDMVRASMQAIGI